MDKIQIDKALFSDLIGYFIFEDTDKAESIKQALESKVNAMVKRDLYSQYKTAKTAEEKEKARLAYLEKIGLNSD